MLKRSIMQRAGKWLAVVALLGFGLAMAQSEPTLNQVYEAAQAGHLEQAQTMMQQVLVAHPNSGKAHYVQAELAARQGQMDRAREALATAEKLSPGLSFAKPEAVQALRTQLAARSSPRAMNSPAVRESAPASPFPWGLALALGGGLIALAIIMLRKKPTPEFAPQPIYASQNPAQGSGLMGPQGFGMGGGAMAPGYGQPGYGQPGYGQPAGSGMGGRLMGGLATGLAVGAGVMAAEAIGKSLMGGHDDHSRQLDNGNNNGYDQPFTGNNDMGGQNFGVADNSSWDDGSSVASSDDGGGWDS